MTINTPTKEKSVSENNAFVKKTMLCIIGLIIVALIALFYFRPLLIKAHLPKPVVINIDNQPTIGNPKAKIHIVAFEDLKCVNCARFNNEIMPYIKKRYIDTDVAQYTMINLAFVPGSLPAANAAHCIYVQNPALFFPFVEYLFQHQPPEDQNWATIPTLMNFASQIPGVNTDQLAACLVKNSYDQIMRDNLTMASKLMGGSVSTPAVYINGIKVNPVTKSQVDIVMEAVK